MAKFNIYKMDKAKESNLLEKLQAVGLSRSGQKTIDGFTLSLYLSQEPEAIDIWWTDLYVDYLGTTEKPKNKAYFAVFLTYFKFFFALRNQHGKVTFLFEGFLRQ